MIHTTTTPSGVAITFEDGLADENGESKRRGYKVDGDVFPSVTTILGCVDKSGALMGWVEKVTLEGVVSLMRDEVVITQTNLPNLLKNQGLSYRDVRDTAATRGTSVHDALEALATDGTPPELADFPSEDRGYVQALCSWWLNHSPEPRMVEQIVASKRLRFAGKFDLLADVQGVSHLVDLKTSKRIYETHHLQTVAYALALEECGWPAPTVCSILRVGEDGDYEFVPANADLEDFEAVVALYEVLKKVRRKPQKVAA